MKTRTILSPTEYVEKKMGYLWGGLATGWCSAFAFLMWLGWDSDAPLWKSFTGLVLTLIFGLFCGMCSSSVFEGRFVEDEPKK